MEISCIAACVDACGERALTQTPECTAACAWTDPKQTPSHA